MHALVRQRAFNILYGSRIELFGDTAYMLLLDILKLYSIRYLNDVPE